MSKASDVQHPTSVHAGQSQQSHETVTHSSSDESSSPDLEGVNGNSSGRETHTTCVRALQYICVYVSISFDSSGWQWIFQQQSDVS